MCCVSDWGFLVHSESLGRRAVSHRETLGMQMWVGRKGGCARRQGKGRAGEGAQLSPPRARAGLQGLVCRDGVNGTLGVRSCVGGCHRVPCASGIMGTALWGSGLQEGLATGHLHFCPGRALTLAGARTHPRHATELSQVHALQRPLILSLREEPPPHPTFRVWGGGWAQPPPRTPLGC